MPPAQLIKVRDLSKWKALVAPLLDKQNLDGFMTSFDVSEREKIEMELMGVAIKAARRKAEAMAAGLGRKRGAATAVTSGDLRNLTRAMGLAPTDVRYSRSPGRADGNRPDFLAIDILKLAQPVDVIFRIK